MTIQSVVGGSVLTALVVLSGGVRCVGTRRPREDVHVLGGGGALGAPLDGGGRGLWLQLYTKEIKQIRAFQLDYMTVSRSSRHPCLKNNGTDVHAFNDSFSIIVFNLIYIKFVH